LMWDPGAVPDADWTSSGTEVAHHLVLPDGSVRDLTLRKPLLAQLAEAGYSPADVSHLAFSHYHYDHTANANAFAHATWLVRRVEREAMFAAKPRRDFVALSSASLLGTLTTAVLRAELAVVERDVEFKTPDGTCDAAFFIQRTAPILEC
jgi:glyoxylase-like metal-dependent hydrolase (beta-lactamase superfamily II)